MQSTSLKSLGKAYHDHYGPSETRLPDIAPSETKGSCRSTECVTVYAMLADARTYYSRMRTVHGVDWETAKQYRDDYVREKIESGVNLESLRKNGFYLSSTIGNQGQTGMKPVQGVVQRV